jgi:hypothetical protein
MKKRFDIFWFGENGPNWIEAVETLQTAKEQIEKLPQNNSGSYAVVDHRTSNRLSFYLQIIVAHGYRDTAEPSLNGNQSVNRRR